VEILLSLTLEGNVEPRTVEQADGFHGVEVDVIPRRNVTGELATLVAFLKIAMEGVPYVIEYVRARISENRVKTLSCGDLHVENPTPEMVESFERILVEELERRRAGRER
jgi:hypothetical protein